MSYRRSLSKSVVVRGILVALVVIGAVAVRAEEGKDPSGVGMGKDPSGPSDLETIAGPESGTLTQKGSMLRALSVEEMKGARAHQLQFTFNPPIPDNALKVKLYDSNGKTLAAVPLKGGRQALLELDPGPSSLQVMLEEQGVIEEEYRFYCVLFEYPKGVIPDDTLRERARKQKMFEPPKSLIDDVELEKLVGGRKKLRGLLKKLDIEEKTAKAFLIAMSNAMAYVRQARLGEANYFLERAREQFDCAEVHYWKAVSCDVFDLDAARERLAHAFELFEAEKSAAELLGKTKDQSLADAHGIAATYQLRASVKRDDLTTVDILRAKRAIEHHLQLAERLDPDGNKDKADRVRSAWKRFLDARRSADQGPSSEASESGEEMSPGVSAFLQARDFYVAKRMADALRVLESTPDLPGGDGLYLKGQILLIEGRREAGRKSLEKSIIEFDDGRCLAGSDGGAVSGADGVVPSAAIRASLAKILLAQFWAQNFAKERPASDPEDLDAKKRLTDMLDKTVALTEAALDVVPSQERWRVLLAGFREARLRYLYPHAFASEKD